MWNTSCGLIVVFSSYLYSFYFLLIEHFVDCALKLRLYSKFNLSYFCKNCKEEESVEGEQLKEGETEEGK